MKKKISDNDSERSLEYIRLCYNVPAKKGMPVLAQGREGIIVGARGPYLRIRLDGVIASYHPTWEMKYLKEEMKNNVVR